MRINSSKQTEASRKNGLKSNGPKSISGKNKIRLNALKDGLFSEEIVIESAGERLEDFEQLMKQMWNHYQPADPMEEILVTDIVDNHWRRLRVRHCETTELNSRIKTQEIRDQLERVETVEKLKTEFLGRFGDLLSPSGIDGPQWDDGVREALASTSLGMDFLINQMEYVESQVITDGYLSKDSMAKMSACGIDVFTRVNCEWWSSEGKKQFGIPETGLKEELPSTDQSEADTDQNRIRGKKLDIRKSWYGEFLRNSVRSAIASLKDRKKTLESVEEIEARTRATMIVLPPDSIDRFSRAETAYERGMYRAISALLALRGASSRGPKLPALPE